MVKAILVAQFLRARAWWRLNAAGENALRVTRSVVSLLDAAEYLSYIPDDDPAMRTLADAGCFRGDVFDPGPAGAAIIRDWQLTDEQTAGPADLLAALAAAANRIPAGNPPATLRIPAQRSDMTCTG